MRKGVDLANAPWCILLQTLYSSVRPMRSRNQRLEIKNPVAPCLQLVLAERDGLMSWMEGALGIVASLDLGSTLSAWHAANTWRLDPTNLKQEKPFSPPCSWSQSHS